MWVSSFFNLQIYYKDSGNKLQIDIKKQKIVNISLNQTGQYEFLCVHHFTTLSCEKKLLSNQLRYKCHYSNRLSCLILKVKLALSPSQFSVWLKKSLTGTFTWYSSRLHAMFAFFPLLPQESQFSILPAFLVLLLRRLKVAILKYFLLCILSIMYMLPLPESSWRFL